VIPCPCDLTAPVRQRIGGRLRELRVDAELTQEQVAVRTGMHRPVVGRLERGIHDVSLDALARYAGALDLDLGTVCCVLDDEWINGALEAERQMHTPHQDSAAVFEEAPLLHGSEGVAATARAEAPRLPARARRFTFWRRF
jgi:transcriptional regulator with XRE-family HTH domain